MKKINLSKELLADLYRKNLVLIDHTSEERSTDNTTSVSAFFHTGGYQKKILWIHEEKDHRHLSDDDHQMITKILEACKLSWDDIALLNIAGSSTEITSLMQQYDPLYLIVSLPHKIHQFHPDAALYSVNQLGKCIMLSTDRPETIRNDKNLKIKLWQALKQLFEL